MEQPKENKSEQKPKDVNPPEPIVNKDAVSKLPEKKETTAKAKKHHTIKREAIPIIINEDKRKDRQSVIANIISGAALALAIVIFIYTYLLFTETQKATKAAQKSADAAQSTYTEQRFNDSIMRERDSVNSIANEINERKRFSIDSTSVQAQINSFIQTTKQFEVQYEPYLEIEDPVIQQFETNKRITIAYFIKNLSVQTAKEDSTVVAIQFVAANDLNSFVKNPFKFISFAPYERQIEYYNIGTPVYKFFSSEDSYNVLQQNDYDFFLNGDLFLFFAGKIKYTNLRNQKPKEYKFVIQLFVDKKTTTRNLSGKTPFQFIYNDNK